jgi:hypothetical protein
MNSNKFLELAEKEEIIDHLKAFLVHLEGNV